MNHFWNRFLNYFFSDCFWCGKRVYLFYSVFQVGSTEHKIHDGPIRNCADQYQEWQDLPTYIGSADEHLTMLPH